MVEKIISCADIHFKNDSENITELNEICERFYEKCKAEVKAAGGKSKVRIVVAGDIFESKIDASNEALVAANEFIKSLSKIATVIIIAGNHDMLMNNTDKTDSIDTIIRVAENKNVIYLDSTLGYKSGCYVDDNIVWCLYSSYDGFNRPNIEQMKEEHHDKTFVGLIHGELTGAMTDKGFISENGLQLGLFEGLSFVIAGHIHRQQDMRHNGIVIAYCSSLKQQNFGETVSGHGYLLWDVNEGEYELIEIENESSPYYTININSIHDLEEDMEMWVNP